MPPRTPPPTPPPPQPSTPPPSAPPTPPMLPPPPTPFRRRYAAAAAADAATAAGSALAAAYRDADFPPDAMLRQPLWHDTGPPDGLRPADIGDTLLDTDPRFAFFKRWHDGMDGGTPVPPELCLRIATKIPRETWESGADAAARGDRGYRGGISDRGDTAPDSAGRWGFRVDDRCQHVCRAASFCLFSGGCRPWRPRSLQIRNGLSETSFETVLIRKALITTATRRCRGTAFWNACMSLNRQIGDVYPEFPR